MMAVFLVLVGFGILMLRRGVIGRMLIAMRDSPAACGTLGLDMRWFRVGLFGVSAGVAGLAGALYAGLRGTVGAADFQSFNSLPLLLLAVVFGVTSVTGATLGGIGLMLLPELQAKSPEVFGVELQLGGLMFVIIGFGAVFAARDPNGLANLLFKGGRFAEKRVLAQVRDNLPALPDRKHKGGRDDGDGEWVDDLDPVASVDGDSMNDSGEVPAHVPARG